MLRIAFHTLGCKVNQYESEALREAFSSRGVRIVSEDEPADVYIVNTCTVTNMADRKSRQYIRRMKRQNPDALMVVTGCYAQVASQELEGMEDVDLIVGNNLKSSIPDRVMEMLQGRNNSEVLPYPQLNTYENMGIVTASESAMNRAYIKIQEGCNRFCSYCRIPYARGTLRSRPIEDIMDEAEMLLDKGFRELVLTGINTALYGLEASFDFRREPGEESLSGLETVVRRLDRLGGDFRIRLSSLEPTVVDIDSIERIIQYRRLCHHLHLSLQSGSNAILQAMNRHYSREDYYKIVDALRAFDPLYGITTDIIVGFPGETEADFEDTLEAVRHCDFGRIHIFRYSAREGTRAASFGGKISGTVMNQRTSRLEEAAGHASSAFYRKNQNAEDTILIEKHIDNMATGYTGNYIRAYIPDPDNRLIAGDFERIRLIQEYNDGCLAEIAGGSRERRSNL